MKQMTVHLGSVSMISAILPLLIVSATVELMYGALLYRFSGGSLHAASISISIKLFCLKAIASQIVIMPVIHVKVVHLQCKQDCNYNLTCYHFRMHHMHSTDAAYCYQHVVWSSVGLSHGCILQKQLD